MMELPKVAFSKTQRTMEGQNLHVENGDLRNALGQLKQAPGSDIIVYGGATFVASLIENALIDEFNLFVAPLAIGNGIRVFKDRRPLTLTASVPYPCGVVVNTYEPR
jgi:dihydrofolate reductase